MTNALTRATDLILAVSESGEPKTFSDGGFLAEAAWLIPVVPLVLAFAIVFFGKRSPWKGWGMAVFSMGFVAVYGTVLFVMNTFGEGITWGSSRVAWRKPESAYFFWTPWRSWRKRGSE